MGFKAGKGEMQEKGLVWWGWCWGQGAGESRTGSDADAGGICRSRKDHKPRACLIACATTSLTNHPLCGVGQGVAIALAIWQGGGIRWVGGWERLTSTAYGPCADAA